MAPSASGLAPFDSSFLSAWTVAWVPDALIAAATIGYLLLLRRAHRRQARPLVRPVVAWCGAMGGLVICFNSSIGIYSDTLFTVHMLQHLMLVMVVPPLLVWAAPWSMVPVRGPGTRTVASVLDASRLWRALTGPLLAVVCYTATVVLTHLTSFQELALDHSPVRLAENVAYLVVGYLLFARLVDLDEAEHRLPDLIRFVVLAAAMGVDTLTGISLMMTGHPLAPSYAAAHPGWGPDALADQAAAGAIMWVVGDGLMMILMIIVGVLWGTRHPDSGLGDWLEEVRRRQLLGDGYSGEVVPAVDVDDAALDAYNAYLAELHRQHPDER